MTTTKAKIEKPTHDKKVSGLFEGPHWCPQYGDYNERRQKELLAKLPAGSHADEAIRGKLTTFTAWGREVYGLELEGPKGKYVVHVPEHTALYGALGCVKMGADVYIAMTGRSDKAKPGQQAAMLYEVIPYNEADILKTPRKDALKVQRKDDGDKAAASSGAIDDGAPPPDEA